MGIINGYSDDQVKGWMQGKTPDQVASQASSMGLNADQIQKASQLGGQNYTANDVNGFAQSNGYGWGANGALTQNISAPAAQPATPPPGGGMTVQGTYYSPQQVTDFMSKGGDPNQFAQQHGITNLDQIHQLSTQARTIAGAANPTGDAAMQNAWNSYKQYNPQGAHVNDYAGFVANQAPDRANAIRAGTYSGSFNDATDYQPGGIYGPGSASYGTPGYASGLGSRGDGANGNMWAGSGTPGSSTGPVSNGTGTGGTGGTGSSGTGSGTNAPGGGMAGSSSSSTYGTNGPGNWTVTPNQTVEGRIGGIINNNSPLMQQAHTRALQQQNEHGTVNSSMATTAADSAVYDAAQRIAQPDAGMFGDAAKTNANAQTSYGISLNNNQTSRDINSANIGAQKELQHSSQLYNNLASQTASANSIQGWGLNTITTIQASDLSAPAKTAAINSIRQYLSDSYQIQGDWHTTAAKAIDAIFK